MTLYSLFRIKREGAPSKVMRPIHLPRKALNKLREKVYNTRRVNRIGSDTGYLSGDSEKIFGRHHFV